MTKYLKESVKLLLKSFVTGIGLALGNTIYRYIQTKVEKIINEQHTEKETRRNN